MDLVASCPAEKSKSGIVLGLLSGGPLGPGKTTRHVFTMRFDPETREWLGYDGGLLRWMKSELLHVA